MTKNNNSVKCLGGREGAGIPWIHQDRDRGPEGTSAQLVRLSWPACLAPWAAGPVTPDLGTLHCARAPGLTAQPHQDPAFPRAGPRLPPTSQDPSSGLSCHGPGGANDRQGQGAGGAPEGHMTGVCSVGMPGLDGWQRLGKDLK